MDWMLYLFISEREVPYVKDSLNIMELQSFQIYLGYLFNVFPVIRTDENIRDAGSLGS